ncbi:MAG: hypothetical protein IJJ40_06840 [Clostridia bacterium]|nr:hypothetical protein [Clostridia bacterium]MBR3144416.1 hypothetical protein [Clostridia bacterium]
MSKGSFLKGMGAGMAAGAGIAMVAKTLMKDSKHNLTKGSAKVVKAMGDIVDGIQTIFK